MLEYCASYAEASTVDFRIYEGMEHDATEGEIDDVCDWLAKVLPDESTPA